MLVVRKCHSGWTMSSTVTVSNDSDIVMDWKNFIDSLTYSGVRGASENGAPEGCQGGTRRAPVLVFEATLCSSINDKLMSRSIVIKLKVQRRYSLLLSRKPFAIQFVICNILRPNSWRCRQASDNETLTSSHLLHCT